MSATADAEEAGSASIEDWIAVLAGALGALIASLDTSIVNSALPQIQGEIGASGTESTWIGTGYLVSEVVMIPLTAWLVRLLGLRNLLLGCTALFTLFSMVCGFSHDLTSMVIGRVGQGFFGGALIPTAQTIVRTRLPRAQLPVGMTLFGLIVLLGPLMGPLLGGWVTENVSWSWCFFLNLPVAIVLVLLLLFGLKPQRSRLDELIHADWLGIGGMTLGLSCLTVVLEEGQRERWFESGLIVKLSLAGLAGFAALMVAQVTSRRPVLKLKLMLNASYATVILMVVVIGMAIYGILYVLPQFLSGIAGYNSLQSGRILFVAGVPAFLLIPILPRLLGMDLRIMVVTGLLCFALSCLLDTHLSADTSGHDFLLPQLLRGAGQILAFMPLNQASMGAVSREDAADAAGLYNMARNLGGSLGLALLGIYIDHQAAIHAAAIAASVSANSLVGQAYVAGQAAGLTAALGDAASAQAQALGALAATVQQQALVLTYSDCFRVLGVALLAMLPLVFLLRIPRRGAPPAEGVH